MPLYLTENTGKRNQNPGMFANLEDDSSITVNLEKHWISNIKCLNVCKKLAELTARERFLAIEHNE